MICLKTVLVSTVVNIVVSLTLLVEPGPVQEGLCCPKWGRVDPSSTLPHSLPQAPRAQPLVTPSFRGTDGKERRIRIL